MATVLHRGRAATPAVDGGRGRSAAGARLSDVAVPRFLQLADVADVLNISGSQAYALVRSGELPAIKVGGRGQWRVESSVLEDYIQRCYSQTKAFVEAHPLGRDGSGEIDADPP